MTSADLFAQLLGQVMLEQMDVSQDGIFGQAQAPKDESFYTTFNNKIMKEHFQSERTKYLNSDEYKNCIALGSDEEKLELNKTSAAMVRDLIDLWMERGKEPSLMELTEYFIRNNFVCACPQSIYGPTILPDYKKFIKCWIARYGEIPPCRVNKLAMDYFQYEHKIPTASIMQRYLENAARFTGESKIGETWTPAKDCNKLITLEREKCEAKFNETSCVLCMETFNKGDKCIQLKCGHIFHSQDKENEEACSGIQTWLEKNGKCPTCNEKIE